jgi:hypothetical protein
MPALTFLAVVGLALIASLFLANATLEPGSPPIVSSQRSGLPEARRFDAAAQTLSAAQPKSAPDAVAKIPPAARATQAEAPPRNKRVVRSRGYKQPSSFAKFSIKGY